MDDLLRTRLNQLQDQSQLLKQAEGSYRLQEAKRKSLEADLFLATSGKSVAEREAGVFASDVYKEFMADLARLETNFNHHRRRFSILESAYLAEYASYKIDANLIRKEGNQ